MPSAMELASTTSFGPVAPPRGAARIGWWPRAARAALRAILATLFRIRLIGVPPERGPYVLVANHQGWCDAFLLIALMPASPRIYFIADRRAALTVWWKRLLLRSLGVIVAVERDGGSERGAIERSLALLADGAVVAIFAEGRVSRAEATLAPFRRGVGYLALKANVPVLPVWLRGTAELYLGRELVAFVGHLRAPAGQAPTKDATAAFAERVRSDLLALAIPWAEAHRGPKRWRWLTDLF